MKYYAISNEFDLKKAWNNKDTWVKENVLKPIHKELRDKVGMYGKTYHSNLFWDFSLKSMRNLLRWYGLSNNQITHDIVEFIYGESDDLGGKSMLELSRKYEMTDTSKNPEFYAYYADYDWVLFCSLFGRMMDLPKGFPMYCRDLKQTLDEIAMKNTVGVNDSLANGVYPIPAEHRKSNGQMFKEILSDYKVHPSYPKQENEHNALDDAKWNKKLHEFIKTL